MPDPEIKIKVTLDSPNDPWAKFKQQVRTVEEQVRAVFAATYENNQQRDAAINAVGDALDDLVYKGAEFEKQFKKIGITPEQQAELEAYVALLNSASNQFERGLNRQVLPQQKPQPQQGEWISWQGPEVDAFKKQLEETNSLIAEYQARLAKAKATNAQMTAALEAELASLDKTASGYTARKAAIESQLETLGNFVSKTNEQSAALEKQQAALAQLNESTNDTGAFAENAQKLNELNGKVVATSEKAQRALNAQQQAAENHAAKMAQIAEKELSQQKKLNNTLQLQGKTYEELIQLYSQLVDARNQAKTAGEIKAIDDQLKALRTQITLTGREAQLSGAKMIGSQTSVQGVFRETIRQWQRGVLTLKGLTKGMQMFAKSTIFLAAIQLAWELLVTLWEKGKAALFGSADAAEKAKEEQEKLATAAKEAADNLLAAQDALANARRDKERRDAAEEFKRQIKEQNDEYQRQIKLVDEATAAQLRQLAMTAKEDERKAAMEKLMLQQELMAGKITEYEYQERLIRLENKAQQAQYERATKQKKIEYNAAIDEEAAAEKNRILTEKMQKKDMSGFEMDTASVTKKVAHWNALKADEAENRRQYYIDSSEAEKLEKIITHFERNGPVEQTTDAFNLVQKAKKELAEIQKRIDRYEQKNVERNEIYSSIPEFVRKLGTNEFAVTQYSEEKKSREEYNANVQSEIDKAIEAEQKAEEAVRKAEREYNEAAVDNINAAVHAGQVAQMRIDMTRRKEHEAQKDKENEKVVQKLRTEVSELEFSVLKKREAELRAEANDTPEGKRKGQQADVYLRELERRRERGRAARERVEFAGRGGSEAEQAIVELAGKAASRAARTQTVDLARAAQILKQAEATRGKADDAAARELYNVIEKLYTAEQANSRQARLLEQRYKRLAAKVAKEA